MRLALWTITLVTVVTPSGPGLADQPAVGTRLHPITKEAFGPWYGSGCPGNGKCGCSETQDMAAEATCQLDHLRRLDIPVTAYLFDGGSWSKKDSSSTSACDGPDCCQFKLGPALIDKLRKGGTRALLHFWGGCHAGPQYQRAYKVLGDTLGGFYLDDKTDDAESRRCVDFLWSVLPGRSECVVKARQGRTPSISEDGLRTFANVGYVGDLGVDWEALQEGIRRVFDKGRLMPAPFAEFTGYAYNKDVAPDEETYMRRLHFGAFQPVMAHTPYANADPWKPGFSPALLAAYRRYAWLHKELAPYFMSYARQMHDAPAQPVIRNANPGAFTTQLGDELFVAYVTAPVRKLTVALPPGRWVDLWDPGRVFSGVLTDHPVPLGHEPSFVREGALVPLDVERDYAGHGTRASKGSLTVLVVPGAADSRFRYWDDQASMWITLSAQSRATSLTLSSDRAPSRPVLYRIVRQPRAPKRVVLAKGSLFINGHEAGTVLTRTGSEDEVNGAANDTWFYDARAQRLIVKIVSR